MACETITSSVDIASFQETICRYARYTIGKKVEELSNRDLFLAVTMAVRERLVDIMKATEDRYKEADAKRLYYLSMEFLMGRSLDNNLYNLGIYDLCREALISMGYDLEEVEAKEPDAALGNGGLGRLAACFLDSLATLGMPGCGYGINYEYGLFKQEIENGYQKEKPDCWRTNFSPWLIERPDEACVIPIYGKTVDSHDRQGNPRPAWVETKRLIGQPCDMPIVGYGGRTVNFL